MTQQRWFKISSNSISPWFTIILAVALLHAIGIHLFIKGFLLTRTELENIHDCNQLPENINPDLRSILEYQTKRSDNITSTSSSCWLPQPAFNKTAMIVIDALRFDLFQQMTNLVATIQEQPQQSLLFRFISDAPTTTSQRLKGLTTGGLPTFIDAGKNFDSDEVLEDNVMRQLYNNNRSSVIIGDDTWHNLFNEYIHRSIPMPSFNVWDLDSVDNGVAQQFIKELENNNNNIENNNQFWDFIVGHLDGVDHAGHRYGVNHPEMNRKIKESDQLSQRAISLMDNDTLFIMLSDHGMTNSGDHGGESPDEVTATLYFFSKENELMDSLAYDLLRKIGLHSKNEREIPQVDFVPTISLLLNLPIPFGNIGKIIPELFLSNSLITMSLPFFGDNTSKLKKQLSQDSIVFEKIQRLWILNVVAHINSCQVKQYMNVYAEHTHPFPNVAVLDDLFETANTTFATIVSLSQHLRKNGNKDLENFQQLLNRQGFSSLEHIEKSLISSYKQHEAFLETASETCRSAWSIFDPSLMSCGIIIQTATLVFLLISSFVTYYKSETLRSSSFLIPPVLFILTFLIYLSNINFYDTLLVSVCIIQLIHMIFNQLPSKLFQHISITWKNSISLENLFALILAVFYTAMVFSNSFIVTEDRIVHYMLISMFVLRCIKLCRHHSDQTRKWILSTFVIAFLSRLSLAGLRLRFHGTHAIQDPMLPESESWFINMTQLCFPLFILYMIQNPPLLITFSSGLISIFVSLYWKVQATNNAINGGDTHVDELIPSLQYYYKIDQEFLSQLELYLPRIVMLSVLVLTFIAAVMSIMPSRFLSKTIQKTGFFLTISNLIIFLWPLFTLLITRKYTWILGIAWITTACYNHVLVTKQERRDPSFASVFTWFLLAQHSFFSTGHQNAFPTLQWTVAFIGVSEAHMVVSGILMVLNTWGSKILVLSYVARYFRTSTVLKICGVFSATALTASMAAMLHRRHLMVWAIFAPKFVFEVGGVAIVDLLFIVMGLFHTRQEY